MLVVLCPLYSGNLNGTELVAAGEIDERTRVYGKFIAYVSTINAIAEHMKSNGVGISLTTVFADRGVLLSKEPSQKDVQLLMMHSDVYKRGIESACNIDEHRHILMSEIDQGIERFVDTRKQTEEPESPSHLISIINRHLDEAGAGKRLPDNSYVRELAKDIMRIGNADRGIVMEIVKNYATFYQRIPDIVGHDGIFIQAERLPQLLRVASRIDTLKNLMRIDIIA